ncbi:MAG TPA: LON peptidase substrate-binding domain-containing protein, partial [Xanthobacteraceae bacterium]|nr:LON peptidase substrate-binding domain-containing protein [Xanthobacteraceae bacterium]
MMREDLREDLTSTGTPAGASRMPAAESGRPTAEVPADALIILPTRNFVLFPGIVFPLSIGRPASIAAAQEAVRLQRQVGVVLQRDSEQNDPAPIDLHRIGTVANIARYVTAPDGAHHLICQGVQRFRVVEYLNGWPFFVARVERIEEVEGQQVTDKQIEARFVNLRRQALEALALLPGVPQELIGTIQSVSSPSQLADLVAGYMDLKPNE